MIDLAELASAVLVEVLVDGSSIGNQSLFECLKTRFPDVTDEQLWAARDALVEQGVLVKGRGRGGSVLRAQSVVVQAAPAAPAATTRVKEVSGGYLAEAPRAVKSKPAVQAATSSEDLQKTLWATAAKLRTSASRVQIELTSEALDTPALCSRHSRKGGNSAALSEYLDISGKPHQPKAEALLEDAL